MENKQQINIHELLAERQQIAAIWSVEDVQSVRPDLNEDQAWEVLQQVEHSHDANLGINWMTLESAADHLYPEPDASSNPVGV